MARNTSTGSRQGAVSGRSQIFNPSTGNYVKRDSSTGKFMSVKTNGKPFKGVVRERTLIQSNPSIKRSIAKKAERAVIKVINSSKKITIVITNNIKKAPKKVAKKNPVKNTAVRKVAAKKTTAKKTKSVAKKIAKKVSVKKAKPSVKKSSSKSKR